MITLFAGNLNDYNIIGNIMVGTNIIHVNIQYYERVTLAFLYLI